MNAPRSVGRGWRRGILAAAVVLVGLSLNGCQFLQNEFFFLDTARPKASANETGGLGSVR